MGLPYTGEIRIFAFGVVPKGWAQCNGQSVTIAQNQALYALLGTTYGGSGQTFNLPNLTGRAPVHPDGSGVSRGQAGGEVSHTLSLSEMPSHGHPLNGTADAADSGSPAGNLLGAQAGGNAQGQWYAGVASPLTTLMSGSVSNTGSGQPHPNMQPYLVLNFCIALVGIFPARD